MEWPILWYKLAPQIPAQSSGRAHTAQAAAHATASSRLFLVALARLKLAPGMLTRAAVTPLIAM